MPANFYPPEGHDWLPTAEIRTLENSNKLFAEAKYCGDVADVKASYISKLLGYNAIIEGAGWAIFDIVPSEEAEGSVATDVYAKDMLVWLGHVSPDPKTPPTLRIITNETFSFPNESAQIMTQDITIDYESDAQILVDALEVRDGELVRGVEDQEVLDGSVEAGPSYAPIFLLLPGGLQVENLEVFTPIQYVDASQDTPHLVSPFGHFSFLDDKLYALSVAQELFETIKDKVPRAASCEG